MSIKICVTGANSFVGRTLCEKLAATGYSVVQAVRQSSKKDEIAVGDIGSDTDWSLALQGCDTVVHLAGEVNIVRKSELEALEAFRAVNVAGTKRLAEQAVVAGVRRFVFLSSIKVNGEGVFVPYPSLLFGFSPTDAPTPQGAYGKSKLEAERALMSIAHETEMGIVIIRPPLVYGPGVKGNFAYLIKAVCSGLPLPLGAIHNKRSLIALDNLVDFITLCVDRQRSPRATNELFLVSDGEDVSTTELLRKIAEAYGKKNWLIPIPITWLARLLGNSDFSDRLLGSLVVDSSKAIKLLGWCPVVTMDEQLKRMTRHGTRG